MSEKKSLVKSTFDPEKAKVLEERYPAIFALARQVLVGLAGVTEQTRDLCIKCRASGLVLADLSTALLSVGFSDDWALRVRRVVEAPKEVFDRYIEGMGFRQSLAEARESLGVGSRGVSSLPKAVEEGFESVVSQLMIHPHWRIGKTVIKRAGWVVTVQVRKSKKSVVERSKVGKMKGGKK
jgi:hypothetical protein